MAQPQRYKRAVFRGLGENLVLEEVDLKLPGANEILIKVDACGICYSDKYAQYNGFGGGFPIVPGHEIIGRVAAVGLEVTTPWKIGDRIGSGWHGGHDGTCAACRQGWFQMCDNSIVNGENKDGGYAEYCTIRAEAAVRVPEHVDAAKYAPVLCAGVTVFNSMRRAGISPGSTVAVQGLGGWDTWRFRQVDAGEALMSLGGVAMVVTTASDGKAIAPLMKGLRPLGKMLVLSVPEKLELDVLPMLRYGLSVQSWPAGHAVDSEEAILFADLHDISCAVEVFPLEQARHAYDAMLSGKVRFRAVLTMGKNS